MNPELWIGLLRRRPVASEYFVEQNMGVLRRLHAHARRVGSR